jgi:hypothetical protein
MGNPDRNAFSEKIESPSAYKKKTNRVGLINKGEK